MRAVAFVMALERMLQDFPLTRGAAPVIGVAARSFTSGITAHVNAG